MSERTVDTIIKDLKKIVSEKKVLNPELWAEAAFDLAVLLGDEVNVLAELQQKVSLMRLEFLKEDVRSSVAKMKVEATDTYKEMTIQKAKVSQIEEIIRVAKLQAKINQGI